MHICEESTGGSEQEKSGHGLVSALHVQTYLSDSKRMLCKIRDGSGPFLDEMKCIIPLGFATQVFSHITCTYIYVGDLCPF